MADVNWGPLSECNISGMPFLEKNSFNTFIMSGDVVFPISAISMYLEK